VSSHQVDGVIDDLAASMRMLRRAMKGVPAEAAGFKGAHDRLAKSVAVLSLTLDDSRTAMQDEHGQ
jgi:hypothetical protein